MNTDILELVKAKKEQLVNCRRDLHKHAETAWTEFRTASIVAETLTRLGYQVTVGEAVIDAEVMMGVPSQQELLNHQERAIAQGAEPNWVGRMQGGKTGVMGVMHFAQPGPVVAFRFDMDANDVMEAMLAEHRPWREGFASVNSGAMHACGHDGHTSIGLALAEVLVEMKNELAGTVKLIFQPAEEGVRGAKAMVSRGIVDDVDFFVGLHLGIGLKQIGTMTCNTVGFLATTKLDAVYTGVPAHAGAAPETGQNALLAAATAALNLHAISRHSQGASRINVGVLQAGTGRNVIPDKAVLKLETRGTTSEINDYMYQRALRILEAAAAMYDVKLVLSPMGGAANCDNNPILVERLQQVAEKSNLFESILPEGNIGGSEDCTYFMERVQQKGGQAAYLMVGTELAAGHHDSRFDFDEESLVTATALLGKAAVELLSKK
ncbi:MAG: iaaH 2 [Sporomusa sp.]|nr:iaaH 2 [Sporomusa sp.]